MKKQTANASQESIRTRIFHSNWFIYVLISPLFLVLFAYVVYPFYQTFTQSIAGDERFLHYKKFFNLASPANLEALWTSIYISIISVLCYRWGNYGFFT